MIGRNAAEGHGAARTTGVVGCALASALVAACGADTPPPDPPPGDPTFSAIHNGILERSCALSSCHGGAAPAAKLDFHLVSADDIIKICHSLVRRRSCLFPSKLLVVPFKPDASFLLDKLHGSNLDEAPNPECAGTNQRMPFGLPALTPNQMIQIENWVSMGADCAGPPPPDADVDPMVDAEIQIPGDVASITAVAASIPAGTRTQVTVTLTTAAPTDGQTVVLIAADPTALGVPAAVRIEAGMTAVTFDVLGKRPALATTITAAAGDNSMSLSIAVTGLSLTEIIYRPATSESTSEWIEIANSTDVPIDLGAYSFGSGRADYTATTTQLSGMLLPRSCFVIGGPASNPGNGNPTFDLTHDFTPDLLNGSAGNGQATGYALFDGTVNQLVSTSIPLDAVLCGQNNGAGLLGPGGTPATPGCPDVAAAGHSVVRTSVTSWVDQATPTPGNCTPISL